MYVKLKTWVILDIFTMLMFALECLGKVDGVIFLEYTMSDYVGVITLVCKKYKSRCVSFLYSYELNIDINLEQTKTITTLEKSLSSSDKSIFSSSSLLDNNSIFLDYKCPNKHRPLVVILFSNIEIRQQLQMLSHQQSMSASAWLVFLSDSSTEDYFSDIYIPFSCQFLVAERRNDFIELRELYRVADGKPLITFPFGSWNSYGHNCTGTFLYERRNNLHGLQIKATTMNSPPVVLLYENENGIQGIDGYFGNIWTNLETNFNFTTSFKKGKAFGVKKNGRWNGMIAMLMSNEVEVGVCEFTITPARLKVVEYTTPIIFSSYEFFIRKPRNEGVQWNGFLQPFSNSLWFSICGWVVLLSILLTTFHFLGRRYGNSEVDDPPKYRIVDSFHYMLGIFCAQGQDKEPRSPSCRLVWFIAYITSVTLLAAYSAALVSFLTREHEVMPFNNFKGLLEDGSYKFGVVGDSAEYDIFDKSRNRLIRKLHEKYTQFEENVFPNYEQGMQKVCSSRFVFMASYLLQYRDNVACEMRYLTQEAFPVTMTISVAKHSPYKGILSYGLQKLRDKGALKKLQMVWLKPMQKKEDPWDEVDLKNVVPIFVVLLAAIVTACLLLLIEREWHEVQRRRRSLHKSTETNSFSDLNITNKVLHNKIQFSDP
ncbi:Ionotropic receptor 115 [Blattella germanica]|nr:Ionotropic receptor 115 [Blattella germanica]